MTTTRKKPQLLKKIKPRNTQSTQKGLETQKKIYASVRFRIAPLSDRSVLPEYRIQSGRRAGRAELIGLTQSREGREGKEKTV